MPTTITLSDGSKISTPAGANDVAANCADCGSLIKIETVAQNITTWLNPNQIVSIVEIGSNGHSY